VLLVLQVLLLPLVLVLVLPLLVLPLVLLLAVLPLMLVLPVLVLVLLLAVLVLVLLLLLVPLLVVLLVVLLQRAFLLHRLQQGAVAAAGVLVLPLKSPRLMVHLGLRLPARPLLRLRPEAAARWQRHDPGPQGRPAGLLGRGTLLLLLLLLLLLILPELAQLVLLGPSWVQELLL
jgi:hypothetical protein